MSKRPHTIIVYTSPVKGREDEFNRWYTDQHLGELRAVPGMLSGRRFKLLDGQGNAPTRYVAIYEVEDFETYMENYAKCVSDGSIRLSPSLDVSSVSVVGYEPMDASIKQNL